MKRTLSISLFVLLFILLSALPALAQTPEATASTTATASVADTPLDWIPADFDGFVRIDLSDPANSLTDMNVGLFVAAILQPARTRYTQRQTFDNFFPLDSFDVENFTFTNNVLPWLKDEFIVAYKTLNTSFAVDANDAVLILPTTNALAASDALAAVIKGQDFPKQENYRNVIVYQGDHTAFAVTPSAVLAGPVDLLHETIDTMLGSSPSLTASPVYQQVRAALPPNNLIFGYLGKNASAHALGALLSSGGSAQPFLTALTQSLDAIDNAKTPDRLLLSGAVDGVAVGVDYDQFQTSYAKAHVILHTSDTPEPTDATFDSSVLNLIPRSAMLVQSGTDASTTATEALYSLPYLNFAGKAFSAFPISPSAAGTILTAPSADQIETVVNSFLTTVKPVVDVQSDLIDKIKGSYALALIPRPNDPLPVLDTPFDLLLVVKTDSADTAQAVQASAAKLLATFTAPLQSEQVESQTFQTLSAPDSSDPVVRIGAVGNMVVIGTGSAVQLALQAQQGDDRLTNQARWKNLSQNDQIPYVYVDVNAIYNTFLPTAGGPTTRPISQLGIQSRYLGNSLFALDVTAMLP
ncbi:MAG TPA: hypothetical protein VHD90_26445 [Phototrophicaceae bacterium]|nr:hypothetical protein [Phototrophicaceae bacterium]